MRCLFRNVYSALHFWRGSTAPLQCHPLKGDWRTGALSGAFELTGLRQSAPVCASYASNTCAPFTLCFDLAGHNIVALFTLLSIMRYCREPYPALCF